MRPGVVWFGEALPAPETERVEDYLQRDPCGVVIVAGTTAALDTSLIGRCVRVIAAASSSK